MTFLIFQLCLEITFQFVLFVWFFLIIVFIVCWRVSEAVFCTLLAIDHLFHSQINMFF